MDKFKRTFKFLKWTLILLGGIFLLGIILIFIFKQNLADTALNKAKEKLKKSYNITLNYEGFQIKGISKINFSNIDVSVENSNLLHCENFSLSPNLIPLIFGELKLSSIDIKDLSINLNNFKKIKSPLKHSAIKSTVFQRISRYSLLIENILNGLPNEANISKLTFFYKDSFDMVQAKLTNFKINSQKISGKASLLVNDNLSTWDISGTLDNGFSHSNFQLSSPSTQYLNSERLITKYKTNFGFNKLFFGINGLKTDDKQIEGQFLFGAEGFKIINQKLSKDTVIINKYSQDFNFYADESKISLRPNSVFNLNELKSNFGINYHLDSPKAFTIEAKFPLTSAQSIINSLPIATFDKVKTMQMEGKLSYNLNFYLRYPDLDSAYINSDLEGLELKITDFGLVDIPKLNHEFEYQPFNSKRKIMVGISNPSYTPLTEISQDLQDAVTESEDGDFYFGNGFNEPAFAKSIIENIKAKSFKRGGSTICMQLVKNVFLSHKKTIDRKLEEIIINWLIQDQKIVTRARILEVYLNIIEWGPNIYGIGEASQFYFAKHPSEITLNEAIYLAMIIPSPKSFRYQFDKTGHLRDHVKYYYNKIGYLMQYRGKITQDERDGLSGDVQLTGRAKKNLIIEVDSSAIDSLIEINKESGLDNPEMQLDN